MKLIASLEKLARQNICLYYWGRLIFFWWCYFFRVSHEPEFMVLSWMPERSGEILDVGANDGISAISIRTLNRTNPILSLEPNRIQERRLRWLSGRLTNFSFKIVAAGEEPGLRTLYTPVYKGFALTSLASLSAKSAGDLVGRGMFCDSFDREQLRIESQTIRVIRVDDLKLNPILVKIDTEGGELSALKGMEETLRRSRPALIVESERLEETETVKFLTDLDYDVVDAEQVRSQQSISSFPSKYGIHVFWPRELPLKQLKN